MNKTTITAVSFIEAAFAPYFDDPRKRAIDEVGDCSYYQLDTGNVCVVGQFMKDPQLFDELHSPISCDSFEEDDWSSIKEGFKDVPEKLWSSMQTLHDDQLYWDADGVTDEGKIMFDSIKDDWKDTYIVIYLDENETPSNKAYEALFRLSRETACLTVT